MIANQHQKGKKADKMAERNEEKAKKLITLSMSQPINEGMAEMSLFCPSCYKVRKGTVEKAVVEKVGKDQVVINQCDVCRSKGKKINLESWKAVLNGERLPFPDLDESYTLSDLVNDLLKKDDDFPEAK